MAAPKVAGMGKRMPTPVLLPLVLAIREAMPRLVHGAAPRRPSPGGCAEREGADQRSRRRSAGRPEGPHQSSHWSGQEGQHERQEDGQRCLHGSLYRLLAGTCKKHAGEYRYGHVDCR